MKLNQVTVFMTLFVGALLASVTPAGAEPSEGPVRLSLTAEKKTVQRKEDGKSRIVWQTVGTSALLQPGEVIRYTVQADNHGERPVEQMAITQPVPAGTVYVLHSAVGPRTAGATGATRITFSIDDGKSFVDKPTVTVTLPGGALQTKPAPAEAYTHVRWNLETPLVPGAPTKISYQVRMR